MTDVSQDAALAAKKAQDSELVALQNQVNRLRNDLTPSKTGQQKLRKACTDFEAVFITKMWEQMRATVPKSGLFNSQQEEMYRSMFDRDFAEKLAGDGGIGLGDMLYSQLKDKIKNAGKGTSMAAARAAAAASGAESSTTVTTSTGTTLNPARRTRSTRPTASLPGQLPASQPAATTLEQPAALRMPKRPAGGTLTTTSTGAASATSGASVSSGSSGSSVTAATATSSATSAAGSTNAAATTGASASSGVPASVPGAVMAEVEALARRIEADYASRQSGQTAGTSGGQGTAGGSTQEQGQSTGRSVGTRASGYGRQGGAEGSGRLFARIG